MTVSKNIIFKISLYLIFCVTAINSEAQICSGTWSNNSTLNWICIYGDWIGRFNGNFEPPGCPINPTYTSGQSNTFTFDYPVGGFIIDFKAFTSAAGCARMEIKINDVFYPLTPSNITDIPLSAGCTGSSSFITITNEGYIASTSISTTTSNGTARITINGVNATSVTISTNDPAGTIVSAPFNCIPVVPLKLLSFKGENIHCKTQLTWETGIESNVRIIEIQKSKDGSTFYKVGEVAPKGNNSHYSFEVNSFSNEYFRLKVSDIDGSFNYSEILYIKSSCNDNEYTLVPNPASTQITITGLRNTDNILVTDISGRKLQVYYFIQGNKINIKTLPKGIYLIKVFNGNVSKATLKLLKN